MGHLMTIHFSKLRLKSKLIILQTSCYFKLNIIYTVGVIANGNEIGVFEVFDAQASALKNGILAFFDQFCAYY
jgi:hypothetical protein